MYKKHSHLIREAFIYMLFVIFLCIPEMSNAQDRITNSSGLSYIDTKIGNGAEAKPGQSVVVHYTGWIYVDGSKGQKFDSSLDRNQPFSFPLGAKRVISGWDEGVAGMKIGGHRTLIIPPNRGYGAAGAGGVIPPNATLLFEVELIEIE
jgi:FKBP-type peptidyl-prolyl cis-trans isomerase